MGDLQRAPARCSIRPLHRPKLQVAACSRADASCGLFVTSPCVPPAGKLSQHATRDLRDARRPLQRMDALQPSSTAQPRAHGSKFERNPSSWARVVPALHSGLCPTGPWRLQWTCLGRASVAHHSITRLLGKKPWWWTCKKPRRHPQTAYLTAHARRWPCLAVAMRLHESNVGEQRAAGCVHTQLITPFPGRGPASRAPTRLDWTCTAQGCQRSIDSRKLSGCQVGLSSK